MAQKKRRLAASSLSSLAASCKAAGMMDEFAKYFKTYSSVCDALVLPFPSNTYAHTGHNLTP